MKGTETADMIAEAEAIDMTIDGKEAEGLFIRPNPRRTPVERGK